MANKVLDSAHEHAEWLARRRTMLGSSDAPIVCGASRWKTPLHVYLSKIEPLADEAPSVAMLMGLAAEPVIASLYSQRTGEALETCDIITHPEHDWMGASIDRRTSSGKIVELKLVGQHMAHDWGDEGSDEVPEYVTIQVQHQMAVAGVQEADVAAIIGNSFRLFTVPRSESAIRSLIVIEADFWDMVRRREAPEPDWSHAATPELIDSLYKPNGPAIQLGYDEEKMANEYKAMRAEHSRLDKESKVLKAKLTELMGNACEALLPGGRRITRKEITRAAYSVAECSYVDFRVSEPKKAKVKA